MTGYDYYQKVVLKLAGVDAIRVVDGTVPLHDTNTTCTCTVQVTHGVKSDIAKSLHNNHQTAIISREVSSLCSITYFAEDQNKICNQISIEIITTNKIFIKL